MFEVVETQKIVEGEADITLVPKKSEWLVQLLAASESGGAGTAAAAQPKRT